MKANPHTPPSSHGRGLAVGLLLAIAVAPCSLAQPAPVGSAQPTSTITPPHLIAPDQLDAHVQMILSRLDITNRSTDPFGQLQDTNVTPKVVKTPTLTNRRPTRMKATSFDEIIGRIRVNTIMPAEKRFLIGTRSFRKGDTFPIEYRGHNHQVKVVSVSATEIEFEKVETGETASLKLNILPAGMQAGGNGISAPGLEVNDPNAPLKVDGAPETPLNPLNPNKSGF